MSFGSNLKVFREGLGMTQKNFADKLGLSAPSIIAYEKGTKNPSFEVLLNIARQFNASLDYLCDAKKTDTLEIVNWSDAFKVIKALGDSDIPMRIEEDEDQVKICFSRYIGTSGPEDSDKERPLVFLNCEPSDGEIEIPEDLSTFPNPLFSYISAFSNMRELFRAKRVDEELYDLWAQKENTKHDRPISQFQRPTTETE